jgi:hypothetical protein
MAGKRAATSKISKDHPDAETSSDEDNKKMGGLVAERKYGWFRV